MLALRSFTGAGLICRNSLSQYHPTLFLQARCVKLKATPYVPPACESYDNKNMRLDRPMSPRLSIYKKQMQTIMSVTHRGTGMVAYFYVLGLAAGSFLPWSCPEMIAYIGSWNLPAAFTLHSKWCLAYPITYHMFNGIRHLNWDMGRSLSTKGVFRTGYAVLFATLIVNTIIALL